VGLGAGALPGFAAGLLVAVQALGDLAPGEALAGAEPHDVVLTLPRDVAVLMGCPAL
jgi:hypothetical protein